MIRMSKREKVYITVGGAFVGSLLLWLLIVNPYLSGIENAKNRIETGRRDLSRMIELYTTYASLRATVDEIEGRIPDDENFTILSALEQLANEAGVSDQITSMEERNNPDNEFYREMAVEVSLRQVPLRSLIDYLHGIESSPNLLLVSRLTMNTRFNQRNLIDAKVEVASFRPL